MKIQLHNYEIKLFADIIFTITNNIETPTLAKLVLVDYFEGNKAKLLNRIMSKKKTHDLKLSKSVAFAFDEIIMKEFTLDETNKEYHQLVRKIIDTIHRQTNTIDYNKYLEYDSTI